MHHKLCGGALVVAVVAAGLSLAAAPALAAGACADPGPMPAASQFPNRPAMPAGVRLDQVYQCRLAGAHATSAALCNAAPLGPYLKALDAWDVRARAFLPQMKAWQASVDTYAACVETAVAPFGPFIFTGGKWITAP